jgi:chromosome segregation ATPase
MEANAKLLTQIQRKDEQIGLL